MSFDWNGDVRISTEFAYRGIDAAVLENRKLRVLVLPGKGGDILEFRDKRTDVDVLWHADHNWHPPKQRYVPSEMLTTSLDHYPGGWQVNLPIAGYGREIEGNAYGLHGETALLPWEYSVSRSDATAVELELSTELVRYPFVVERTLRLPAGESRLEISESVINQGNVELEYIWQQHLALGRPLVGPNARLDLPARRGQVEEYEEGGAFRNGRLEGGEPFDWPHAPGRTGEAVDLREFPPLDAEIHDQVTALDLEGGWYAVTNTDLNLGFGFTFPTDPFECVWYWQPLGGFEASPFFNRNYTIGLEPTTAYPSGDIPEAQRDNGTMKTLDPGETVSAEFSAQTYHDVATVDSISADGELSGTSLQS